MVKNRVNRPKWESEAEYAEFKEFLVAISERVDKIRKDRRGKTAKRAKKGSGQPSPYTIEFMDTDPHRIDAKYFQALIAGRMNFTMLTLFKLCHKLEIQPQALFKGIGVKL